jgi:uncharacterized membrane protein YqhA
MPRLIFLRRWLQPPLYLGLIVAQAVYVWQFMVELAHLVQQMLWQTVIHMTFLISAVAVAAVERVPPDRQPH